MTKEVRAKDPPEVREVLDDIVKGLEKAEFLAGKEERVAAGVEANVRWSIQQLQELIRKRKLADKHGVKVAGAVYDLHQGKVNFLK